jgi:hypothetical protein
LKSVSHLFSKKGPAKAKELIAKQTKAGCTDDTILNMVVGHCIRRELFFQCPGLATTDQCKTLVKFGEGCPMFPMPPRGQYKSSKKENKGKDV